ncbi:MAG: sodium/solute symporter [Akkermansia sp.]|nr:sodium/solute symporter [Akkermansia sp.]
MKQLMYLPALVAMLGTAMAQETAEATAEASALAPWEMVVFCLVVVGVIGLGIWKSGDSKETEEEKKEKGAADYFLAGRGLSWWLVGFSLLAANISTEQFVGMSGQAADWLGLAIAGYEWLAAIVLVIVAFTFLPMLLKRGVFTIPQFLEERYNGVSRVTMALVNLLILVGVPTATVIYAGANVVAVYFGLQVWQGCLIIAACATVYVYVGGLKACAWTDLIWGAALIVGGGVVAYFAIAALGSMDIASAAGQKLMDTATVSSGATADAMQSTGCSFCDGLHRLWTLNDGDGGAAVNGIGGKLHMIRPANDPVMPWTVYLLGLWIPNFFYWGLNQYIMQRTLASKSLEEGQLGVVFAAFLKLLIPFVVIIPGILAYNLFRDDLSSLADKNTAAVVTKAEADAAATGKAVIYNLNASRLIRTDSAAEALEMVKHNAEVASASDAITKITELGEQLAAIPAANIGERAEVAQHIMEVEADVTKAARADEAHFIVTSSLAAYHYDSAFATLLKRLLPGTGWAWFVLAALFGAVVSSLASMLNSASTLFTMDIYGKAKEVCGSPASPTQLVAVGKVGVLVCALIATAIAPFLDNPAFGGIFTFIQEFQGFLSPGVLAVFLFGFFVPKCPRVFGWLGIVLGAVAYASCKWVILPDWAFLDRMAVSFLAVCVCGLILTLVNIAKGGEAVVLTDKGIIEIKPSARAKVFGIIVVILTIALYAIFW